MSVIPQFETADRSAQWIYRRLLRENWEGEREIFRGLEIVRAQLSGDTQLKRRPSPVVSTSTADYLSIVLSRSAH